MINRASVILLIALCGIAIAADAPPSPSQPPSASGSPASGNGAAPSGGSSSSSNGQSSRSQSSQSQSSLGQSSQRGSASSPPTPARVSFTDQYGILAERNIFLRDRTVRRPSNERSSTTQPARPVEESFVVRGIVLEDGKYRAYVEDTGRASTTRVTAGDSLARGKVTRIEIDGIEYDANDKQTWVINGSDLTGRNAYGGSVSLGSTDTPTTGPTSLPFDPNDPSLSIEQRMRLRRMQGR